MSSLEFTLQRQGSESESHSVVSHSLWLHGLYSSWNSPGQNTGVGSLSLLQGIFPTQGSNPGLPHCGRILYQLSHKGSPRILEWVAYPFSSVSSQPRNWTRVSCIAGGFFTNWWTYQVSPSIRKTSNKHKNYVEYIVYQLVWYILYSFTRASIIMCHKLGILKQ